MMPWLEKIYMPVILIQNNHFIIIYRRWRDINKKSFAVVACLVFLIIQSIFTKKADCIVALITPIKSVEVYVSCSNIPSCKLIFHYHALVVYHKFNTLHSCPVPCAICISAVISYIVSSGKIVIFADCIVHAKMIYISCVS